MNGDSPIEIVLNPPPLGDSFAISPDGSWVIYQYFYYPEKTDEIIAAGTYLGSLQEGSSHLIASASFLNANSNFFKWSPDSAHVVLKVEFTHLYLSDSKGLVTPIADGRFIGWVDNNRYLYFDGSVLMGEIGKEENVRVIQFPSGVTPDDFTFVFPGSKAVR
ncbi:MAG: hypothetical protein ACOYYU_21400 [Chloroflexota bacterium]